MVEVSVARIAAAGRAAWPELAVPEAVLAAHVAASHRDDPDGGCLPAHDADYYLSVALAHRVPTALPIFERAFAPHILLALQQLRLPAHTIDEVHQTLRLELLVGEPAPRIGEYGGRGALTSWLRVTATRKAFKHVHKNHREEDLDELLMSAQPDGAPDPATQLLYRRYGTALKAAVAEALAGLEVRQRNMLRQHIVDGLTIDELALLYRVHRATCARWLADARTDLARHTRRRLAASLETPSDEISSLLRELDGAVEISISRLLRERA